MAKRIFTVALLLASVLVVMVGATEVSGASSRESLKPVGPDVPKSGGVLRITRYSDNDGATSSVVVTGVIGDFGKAIRTNSPGSSGSEYNELDLHLTRGTFGLSIARLQSELGAAISGHFPTNQMTYSGEVGVSSRASIDPGSGTGAYKGLSGNLVLTITINEVESPPRCPNTDTSPFLAQSVFISGSGKVALLG